MVGSALVAGASRRSLAVVPVAELRRFKLDTTELAPRATEHGFDVRSIIADRKDMVAVLDLINDFLVEKGFTAKPREIFHEDEKPFGHTYGRDYYSRENEPGALPELVLVQFGALSGDAHATIAIKALNTTLDEIKVHVEMYRD